MLLKELLEFNPHFRSSSFQCIKHKIFDQFRVQKLEQPAPFKVKLDLDLPGAFNYEETDMPNDNTILPLEAYVKYLANEIQLIK